MGKRKLSFDGWLLVIIAILVVVIIAEGIIIKSLMKGKEEKPAEEESYIVLYEGCEISTEPGTQYPEAFSDGLNDASLKKYETTYYNYENGLYEGESQGTISPEGEGPRKIENVKRIAFSKKFNSVPRAFEKLDEVPEEIADDLKEYETINADLIDIDGDGTKEYFVCVQDLSTDGGKPVAYSALMLYSHDYGKISDLVILEDGVNKNAKSKSVKSLKEDDYRFLSLEDIEYIDLNDDNIMEILINVPANEIIRLNIFEYSNYEVLGEKVDLESLNP